MAKYSPSLTLSPDAVPMGDYFEVSGSGFNPIYGNVIIGFTGGSWGGPVEADGTFSIGPIAARSGDSLPAGDYPVTAYQVLNTHSGKFVEVAEATLTVS